MKTLDNFDVAGKRVLVRLDLNSPVDDGIVQMSARIKQHAKTIRELSDNRAKVVILAHQGRKGEEEYVESLYQHSQLLEKEVGKEIKYIDYLFGSEVIKAIKELKEEEILLLKNTRSWDPETENLTAKQHAKGALVEVLKDHFDLFVQDALSVCHRSHASVTGFAYVLPSCAGRVLEKELKALEKVTQNIERPFVLVLGGSKPSDYTDLINKYLGEDCVDSILGCGLFGQVCLIAKGVDLGKQQEFLEAKGAMECIFDIKKIVDKITVPLDVAVKKKDKRKELKIEKLPSEYEMFDIGSKTIGQYCKILGKAKTIFLKGTPGYYLYPEFKKGTLKILKKIGKSKAFTMVSGGDSSSAVEDFKIKGIDHVSLSGGALLKYLAGKRLPGLEILENV